MQMLLTLRFDGTAYHGFQVQKNALSVCTRWNIVSAMRRQSPFRRPSCRFL